MNRFIFFSVLLALPLLAQDAKKPEESKPKVQKVFVLKYADPGSVSRILNVFGAYMTYDSSLHTLAVSAGPELMPAIEDAIKRLDVPAAAPQNIELTVYYLIGGDSETTPGGPIPKDLESVVSQLKNSFAFKTYHLMDTLALRTRSGQSADTSSSPGPLAAGAPALTDQLHIRSAALSADGSTVSVSSLKAGIRIPVVTGSFPGDGPKQYSFSDLGFNADVDIKKDQKVVVGRMSVNKDQALFLVLTARVVN